MNNYFAGEIVLVEFFFTETTEKKRRPGLVLLDTGDEDIIVARITSKPHYTDFDIYINEWQKAGLLRPSTVRLHKINTLAKSLINRRLGQLESSDLQNIKIKIQEIWFSVGF
ncbi:hypothetical protein PCC8801_1820 [Rippkaea orientalis PCC 8801]|uniref:Transcriptional modulator of MazE/toxin, MazF n=1 Tax=Rippkaea orientalis (strain PCC 8801 / RF-1) TaxID=41431 RepID=B7JX14_RIPO1|nr:type II toxin-antitoxin system PemK/MazF family toxin [Rippkaea orientalis]ACK65863.1 hypothetical protein PCC8801_1820 [Rippkaea orientalis PCC 8801]